MIANYEESRVKLAVSKLSNNMQWSQQLNEQ